MRTLFILCGGKGKRLGAITRKVPKPLIKINGRPFISRLLEIYSPYFERVYLLAGYMGSAFQPLEKGKVKVRIEKEALGTGGALCSMEDELPEMFFVCNGDTFLYPFQFQEFIEFCEKRGSSALLLTKDERRARGSVQTSSGKVVSFLEKDASGEGSVYTGICCLRRSDLPKPRGEFSLEKQLFPALASSGKLLAMDGKCRIYDIGTPSGIIKFKSIL